MKTPNSEFPVSVDQLFDQARTIDSEIARRKFVRQQCGDNFQLEQQVLAKLRQQAVDPPSQVPVNAEITVDQSTRSRVGETIGPYHLVKLIGEGGFGEVYVAEQKEPVVRRVALKLLRPGMESGQVAARFEVERKALALMNHPNIAKVLDGGNSVNGQPYFVMELVDGCSLTQFCDQHQLDVKARLRIFTQVCDAVEHAHKKGIIHRDLKPSNVLVTLENGKPVPKVIDFGVAKTLDQNLTDESIHTGFAQMIGTPLYMSPEQAGLDLLDVDTRSDVYSLGILLYELLTGETPLTRHADRNVSYDDVRQLVREEEAAKPSHRVQQASLTMVHAARNRGCHPEGLWRQVQGDLDWIVLKAVEKDRERRYQSASALADDVRRYLQHEPVQARPPSSWYRLSKFVRKHRVLCAAATIVLVTMVAATAFSSWQAYRATQSAIAEQQAKGKEAAQRKIAEQKAREAEIARREEERKRKLAEAIRDTFVYVLRSPHPEADGRLVTVYELLENAQSEIERAFENDPETRAHLLVTIGSTLMGLELADQAVPLFEQAVDLFSTDPETREELLKARVHLCASLLESTTPEPGDLQQRALDDHSDCEVELGAIHPVTIQANMNLSQAQQRRGHHRQAIARAEQAVATASSALGTEDPQTLRWMNDLALAHLEIGNERRGVELLENIARQRTQLGGESSFAALVSRLSLANVYLKLGATDQAARIANDCFQVAKTRFGTDHPFSWNVQSVLANVALAKSDFETAIRIYQEILNRSQEYFGPNHLQTFRLMNHLAYAHRQSGQLDQAIRVYDEAIQRAEEALPGKHPLEMLLRHNRAETYLANNEPETAVEQLKQVVADRSATIGLHHPETHKSIGNLAQGYLRMGESESGIRLLEKCTESIRDHLDQNHPSLVPLLESLSLAYQQQGDVSRARSLVDQAVLVSRQAYGPGDPRTVQALIRAANRYADLGDFQHAETLLTEALATTHDNFPSNDDLLWACRHHLARVYRELKQYPQAIQLLEENLRLKRLSNPGSDSSLVATIGDLAGTCLLAGKTEEAIRHFDEFIELSRQQLDDRYFTNLLVRTATELSAQGQYEIAEQYLDRSIKIREDNDPKNWLIPNTKSMLGEVIAKHAAALNAESEVAAEQRYEQAESLLNLSFQALAEHPSIPETYRRTRLAAAASRLEELYKSMEKPDLVTSWQNRIEEIEQGQLDQPPDKHAP